MAALRNFNGLASWPNAKTAYNRLTSQCHSINIQTWPAKDGLVRYWRIANDLYTAHAERGERTDLTSIKVGVDDCPTRPLRRVRDRDSGGK